MKKNKGLIFLASLLTIFFVGIANAEAKTVNVYFFNMNGCSHCAEAKEFFAELEADEEYKDMFAVQSFEVSTSRENSDLMDEASEIMGDDNNGAVPYIIVGDESFIGYSDSVGESIKEEIKETYEDDDFVDPLAELIMSGPTKSNDGIIILAILGGVVVIVGLALYFARKDTTKLEKSIALEEKKEEAQKEEVVEEVKTAKKTTTKKKTTKKSPATKKPGTTKKTTTKKKTTKK